MMMNDDTTPNSPSAESAATGPAPDEKRYWLDDPGNVSKIYLGLWIACLLLIGADLLYHKHAEFWFEEVFGFFAIFGFASYAFIVLSAKQLRKVLKREEDYYDR